MELSKDTTQLSFSPENDESEAQDSLSGILVPVQPRQAFLSESSENPEKSLRPKNTESSYYSHFFQIVANRLFGNYPCQYGTKASKCFRLHVTLVCQPR